MRRAGQTPARKEATIGKTSWAVKARYNEKNYDRLTVSIPKGLKEPFKDKCQANNDSMAAVITKAIEEYLDGK